MASKPKGNGTTEAEATSTQAATWDVPVGNSARDEEIRRRAWERHRLFTQDCAISFNPSLSGSLRTSQGVLKYMVARCSAVYVGQRGRPS